MDNIDAETIAAQCGHTTECVDLAAESLEGAGFPDPQDALRHATQALDEGDCTCYCPDDVRAAGFMQGTDQALAREAELPSLAARMGTQYLGGTTMTRATGNIKSGTVVEVFQPGDRSGQYAVVTDKPTDLFWDGKDRIMVWVRYDNGCIAPVDEYHVREITGDQIIAKLNAAKAA